MASPLFYYSYFIKPLGLMKCAIHIHPRTNGQTDLKVEIVVQTRFNCQSRTKDKCIPSKFIYHEVPAAFQALAFWWYIGGCISVFNKVCEPVCITLWMFLFWSSFPKVCCCILNTRRPTSICIDQSKLPTKYVHMHPFIKSD